MPTSPITARLTDSRTWSRPHVAVFHNRYRGFAARTHAHAEAQFLIPLSGRMHMVAGGRAHVLSPELAVWLPPGLPHSFVHVDGHLDFLAIECDPTSPTTPPALAALTRPLVAGGPGFAHMAQTLALELQIPDERTDRVVSGCLDQVFVYLERAMALGATTVAAASSEIGLVIEAILAGYATDLRVPELAGLVGLSPRQLERRFHDELGRTPKRFIMEVRVGAAENLLRTTDHPIAQIALDVGFQTPSHFTDTFKTLTGRLPTMVRQESVRVGT